jgi:hypothetical protein
MHHASLKSTFFFLLICLTKQRAKQASMRAFSGSGSNNHKENIGFRDHVKERKVEYVSTDVRLLKKRIAQEVLDATSASGARFLKKADANDRKKLEIESWHILRGEVIHEKVKQALRQKAWVTHLPRPRPS